ncbi:MAG: HAD hydrolase-like protein [Leucobacter sp.]
MAPSTYSCILWDVDGTIADASRGIFARINTVLAAYGRPVPEVASLSSWIGPPLLESFEFRGGLPADQAVAALAVYRALSAEQGHTTAVDLYPGVPKLVRDVRAAGIPQSTASTKPEAQVRSILDHFELLPEFTAISGARSGPEGHFDGKSYVVEQALARLAAAGADISNPVLIGDRHYDVEGGAEHGVPVIFVGWGFGDDAEAEGAIHRVATPEELRALILA